MQNQQPQPTQIEYHKQSALLALAFDDGQQFEISAHCLRVHSPSAEVQGYHGEPTLVLDKAEVKISAINPVGHYAVQLVFDDGHDSGIYTWQWLYMLGRDQVKLMAEYHQRELQEKQKQAMIIPVKVDFHS